MFYLTTHSTHFVYDYMALAMDTYKDAGFGLITITFYYV